MTVLPQSPLGCLKSVATVASQNEPRLNGTMSREVRKATLKWLERPPGKHTRSRHEGTGRPVAESLSEIKHTSLETYCFHRAKISSIMSYICVVREEPIFRAHEKSGSEVEPGFASAFLGVSISATFLSFFFFFFFSSIFCTTRYSTTFYSDVTILIYTKHSHSYRKAIQ